MTTYTQVSMRAFIKEHISLDADITKKARNSRDFLYEQLKALPDKAENFPRLYPNKEIYNYGSFSRKTKIRRLDDIDFMLIFSADGATYGTIDNTIKISVPNSANNLYKLLDDNGHLSSRKVANKIKNNISKVAQYQKAEIRSSQEAVILNLSSYDWSFDIIPAFMTSEEYDGRSYYLIPDGNGHWKKTDPRIDQTRVTDANKATEFNVLEFIRIIKFWNKIQNIKISSYLMENIVLTYFENEFIWSNKEYQLMSFFKYLKNAIWLSVNDPKGIQGDLNDLEFSKKQSIEEKASVCEEAARRAIEYEEENDYEDADKQWRIIFGDEYV